MAKTKRKEVSPYDGKYFYEVVSRNNRSIKLVGPLDNVYFTTPYGGENEYKYAQVVNGKVTTAFTEDEIYVTEKKI